MNDDEMIGVAEIHELLGAWWSNYDEGDFAVLDTLLTDDVHFSCRTDTGATDYEDFVRADVRGRRAVMAWQTEHRTKSPYPLRHHATNVHIVKRRADQATFRSYILVTQIVAGAVDLLSTAVVQGTVRRVAATLRIAELEVVLDTRDSVIFAER